MTSTGRKKKTVPFPFPTLETVEHLRTYRAQLVELLMASAQTGAMDCLITLRAQQDALHFVEIGILLREATALLHLWEEAEPKLTQAAQDAESRDRQERTFVNSTFITPARVKREEEIRQQADLARQAQEARREAVDLYQRAQTCLRLMPVNLVVAIQQMPRLHEICQSNRAKWERLHHFQQGSQQEGV